MKDKESEQISFVKHLYKTATRSMATYSSKFSKHDYTQPQLFVIGCIKKRLRLKYREVVEIIEEMPKLKEILGLDTDMDAYNHCGGCIERCVFSARVIKDGQMSYKADSCYGCGLCVSVCPEDATVMQRRLWKR
ncbi:MAG: 4Fe-4S binding protein [Halobacteriota archaeon]|nr:4Fe-4S binding protein [Halobacteriota archaeon]